MRRIIIVTGPRDAGKTRCVTALVERLRAAGTTVGGVIAEAQVLAGRKTGYSFRDVLSGERMAYAVRPADSPRPVNPVSADALPGTGRGYTFLDTGLAFGRAAVSRAIAAGVAVLVVDEIGPLEMNGDGLWSVVEEAAARFSGRLVLTVRPSLVEALCAKLGVSDDDVRVLPPSVPLDLSG